MAPPKMYEAPHVQLGKLMVKARREGVKFEDFWSAAMRPGRTTVMVTTRDAPPDAIRWPSDKIDRRQWQRALASAKDGWRRAYLRTPPTPSEHAIMLLGELLFGEADDEVAVASGTRGSLIAA